MKVSDLEEHQGRNVYLSISKYLYTTMLPSTTPSPYKNGALFDEKSFSVWANGHIIGRRCL